MQGLDHALADHKLWVLDASFVPANRDGRWYFGFCPAEIEDGKVLIRKHLMMLSAISPPGKIAKIWHYHGEEAARDFASRHRAPLTRVLADTLLTREFTEILAKKEDDDNGESAKDQAPE